MNKNAEYVAASRAKRGLVSTTLHLSPHEMALLDMLSERYGSKKAAILAGLRSLEGGEEPSPEEALRVLALALADRSRG